MSEQPPRARLTVARWLIPPSQREEAEGDADRAVGACHRARRSSSSRRFWREALSLAIASRRRTHAQGIKTRRKLITGLPMATFRRRRRLVELAQDIRHGFRLVRRLPGLALAACTSLAIGIGDSAAFTMIDAALLRPWPYPDADRLMVIGPESGTLLLATRVPAPCGSTRWVGPPRGGRSAWVPDELRRSGRAREWAPSLGEVVALLGLNGPLHPETGRAFIPSEFTPESQPVVAISHRLWRTRYASLPKHNWYDDHRGRHTLPRRRRPLAELRFFSDSDLLIPLTFSEPGTYSEYARTLELYRSLRPGLTPDLAALMLTGRTRYFLPTQVVSVESVRERVFRGFRPTVKILSVVSLIILVVGCLNFATLLTVRSADRQQELAVRIAMGAGRHRIVRQLVTEALVLSVVGGAAVVLLAYTGRRVLAGNATEGMLELSRNLEWRVIAFATWLAVSTGVLLSMDRHVGPRRAWTLSPHYAIRCPRGLPGGHRLDSAGTGSSDPFRSHSQWCCLSARHCWSRVSSAFNRLTPAMTATMLGTLRFDLPAHPLSDRRRCRTLRGSAHRSHPGHSGRPRGGGGVESAVLRRRFWGCAWCSWKARSTSADHRKRCRSDGACPRRLRRRRA